MIEPPRPCAYIRWRHARVVRKAPSRCTASICFQSAKAYWSTGAMIWMPAFETRMSTPPKSRQTCSTPTLTCSSLVTSIWTARVEPSPALISSAALRAASTLRPAIATLAPCFTNCRAISFPIPLAPPVTIAVLSFKCMFLFLGVWRSGRPARCVARARSLLGKCKHGTARAEVTAAGVGSPDDSAETGSVTARSGRDCRGFTSGHRGVGSAKCNRKPCYSRRTGGRLTAWHAHRGALVAMDLPVSRKRVDAVEKIGLGGGCHWCTESIFQMLAGVVEVEQGFIRSDPPSDSFAEGVIVHFNPCVIGLPTLVEVHLRTHRATAPFVARSTGVR